jgi:hypothetical protein
MLGEDTDSLLLLTDEEEGVLQVERGAIRELHTYVVSECRERKPERVDAHTSLSKPFSKLLNPEGLVCRHLRPHVSMDIHLFAAPSDLD